MQTTPAEIIIREIVFKINFKLILITGKVIPWSENPVCKSFIMTTTVATLIKMVVCPCYFSRQKQSVRTIPRKIFLLEKYDMQSICYF